MFSRRVRWAIALLKLPQIFPAPIARGILEQLYFVYRRYFDCGIYRLCRRHPELFKGGHIIDAGSHIGTATAALASVCENEFRVLSVEAEAQNFRALRRRLSKHPRVIFRNLALSDEVREGLLVRSAWHSGAHYLSSKSFSSYADGNSQCVSCSTLDQVISSLQWAPEEVAFVKMDIEGEELRALKGMKTVLEGKDVSLLIEICPQVLRRKGSKPADLFALLRRAGFKFFYLLQRSGELRQIEPCQLAWESGWEDCLCRKHPL